MAFWRRSKSEGIDWKNAPCTPVDAMEWVKSVPERAPRDGRYYVTWTVVRGNDPCLIDEQPATRSEAQRFFKEFERDYRMKPVRTNETLGVRHDHCSASDETSRLNDRSGL